jgi:hypothetical protein
MRFKFFLGRPDHEVHHRFLYSILGGEMCRSYIELRSKRFDERILDDDAEDVVWFFSNWYPTLQKHLKGKQIFIEHGLSMKPSLTPERVSCLNRDFDLIFSSGVSQRDRMIQEGVDQNKIVDVGYTTLFLLPQREVVKNRILISVVYYGDWNEYENIKEILRRMPETIEAYVTIHPSMPREKITEYTNIIRGKENLYYIENQDQLLEITSSSHCIIGGSSSVCTPFWYLGKPVVFIRGKQGRNPFLGWSRIKKKMNCHIFNEILHESTKISHWRQFSEKCIEKAKIAPSGRKLFFPTNWDKDKTIQLVKNALQKL